MRPAAITDQDLASQVARVLRRKECRRCAELIGAAHAPDRDFVEDRLRNAELPHAVGGVIGGGDGIERNAVASILGAEGLDQAMQTRT